MKVIISPHAKKQFQKLQKFDQIVITKKIRLLPQQEQKLSGYVNLYRVRVGNYRIVYRKITEIYIILIGHRKDIYRALGDLLR